MEKKITFKDLDGWLKTAVIVAYIDIAIFLFWFAIGFMEGLAAY